VTSPADWARSIVAAHNEEAPADAGTSRGQEPTGGTMFSPTVEQTSADSNGGVLLRKHYQPTPAEVDASEKLQDYYVRIRYTAPVQEDSEVDGKMFRWSGFIEVVPRLKAIIIRLAPDARESDLELMQWFVRRLLAGHWNAMGFVEKKSLTHGDTWWRTNLGHSARPRLGRYIEACTVQACVGHGKHHVTTVPGDVEHEAEVTEHRDGWYRLRAVRTGDDPWRVDLDVDEYLDARAGADLANDLAWALGAVAKLNEAQALDETADELVGAGRA